MTLNNGKSMNMNDQSKRLSPVPLRLKVAATIEEIEVDLSVERLIRILGIDRNGNKRGQYHLKITRKGRLSLL